jgi:hypothetical protein
MASAAPKSRCLRAFSRSRSFWKIHSLLRTRKLLCAAPNTGVAKFLEVELVADIDECKVAKALSATHSPTTSPSISGGGGGPVVPGPYTPLPLPPQ